ncbi:hypothetical protein [Roseateles microcysteis]|uniref:hypothetical protein n=1 Tax=Roseateles microcysteis TaxID=3119057 RepID=UPI002FE6A66B
MNKISWALPANLISESVEIMRPNGAQGNEGLALWLGDEHDDLVEFTHVLRLKGPGLVVRPLQLSLSLRAISRITGLSDELGVYWAGQIHSHPGRFVDLSPVDRAMGIKVQGYLSVVCPHYAQARTEVLEQCGVHLFDQGSYRRLPPHEVAARIHILDKNVSVIDLEVYA